MNSRKRSVRIEGDRMAATTGWSAASVAGEPQPPPRIEQVHERYSQFPRVQPNGRGMIDASLAGAVHDLGNLLTPITGHCQLLLHDLSVDDPVRRGVQEVKDAAGRALSVARGLLAAGGDVPERSPTRTWQSAPWQDSGDLMSVQVYQLSHLLTLVRGYAAVLLGGFAADHPARADLEKMEQTIEQLSALSHLLLVADGGQVARKAALDLNDLVARAEETVRYLSGPNVELVLRLDPTLGQVRADPSQMERVILNLVANGRDAMPGGGRLTIETGNAELLADGDRGDGFALLSVSDTGCGMDERTLSRIFEPFFTTKAEGEGTGLGLFTVCSIVHGSGGYVQVRSWPGCGSTFRVYLPLYEQSAGARPGEVLP